MEQPRMLFVTRKWPPAIGGMETYSVQLSNALAARRRLSVMSLPGRADASAPSLSSVGWFVVRAAIRVIAGRRRHEVLVVGDLMLGFLAPLFVARSGRRAVVLLHGLDVSFGDTPTLLGRTYGAYTRWLIARLDHPGIALVANSGFTRRLALEHGLPRVTAVPLGVDLGPIGPPEQRDRGLVLFVGRLVPRKGVAWFAETVLSRLPDMRLIAVGPPGDLEERERLEAVGRAEYRGVVDQESLDSLRRRAWITILPNVRMPDDPEGFGLTGIEAAAGGCLVIASDVDGIGEALRGAEAGIVVSAGDPESWVQRIEEVRSWTDREYSDFVANARCRIGSEYSWDRVATQILGLLEERGS